MFDYTISTVYDPTYDRWLVEGCIWLFRIQMFVCQYVAKSRQEAEAILPEIYRRAHELADQWEMENIPWVYQNE